MSLSPLIFNSLLPCPSLFSEVESLADTGILDYAETTTTVQVSVRGAGALQGAQCLFVCLRCSFLHCLYNYRALCTASLLAAGRNIVHKSGTAKRRRSRRIHLPRNRNRFKRRGAAVRGGAAYPPVASELQIGAIIVSLLSVPIPKASFDINDLLYCTS